jgi:hypothetical protein
MRESVCACGREGLRVCESERVIGVRACVCAYLDVRFFLCICVLVEDATIT